MPRSSPKSPSSNIPVRVVGAAIAVGLHAAILAAIISVPPGKIEVELPETVEIHFVELSDEVLDAANNEHPAEEPGVEETVETPVEETQPEPIPELVPESEPEPEPVREREPEPIPAPQPAPEPPPAPEPKPEPPKPQPQPAPKQQPKPAPKPQPPTPQEKPAAAPPKSGPIGAAPSGKESAAVPQAPAAPVDPDRPRMIGKVDYMGKRPVPEYPRASQRRGEQGRVVVRVLISPEGRVLDASVQSSSGYERLDSAALKAVRAARFKPYTENGHAYRAMADIPFDFVL